MSREQWYASTQRASAQRGRVVENIRVSERLSEKTDDPEARDHDEATQLFYNGVKLARISGDFEAASAQIACAYLLDSRSVNFVGGIPENLDAAKKNMILDYELMGKLAMRDPDSLACSVLTMMLAQFMGSDPIHGQSFIATGMLVIEKLLEHIQDNLHIEKLDNGILGGCLTRTNLLYQRSAFHMSMGNRRKAIKDLTKALKIDEFCTKARESRACVWAAVQLKDDKTIHKEFQRIISEHHQDHRGNDVAYAWLATTTLNDSSLGSIEDAKMYYDKCLQAIVRRDDIYGQRSIDQIPSIVQNVHARFQQQDPNALSMQRDLSDIIQGMRGATVEDEEKRKNKHNCVKCGARRKADGGAVMKCARCKSVSYCSRDCQVADWKSHKMFCKIIKNKPKLTATTGPIASKMNIEKPLEVENNVAKDCLSEWDGFLNAAKRMESELGDTYKKYGKFFAKWWNDMSFNEKKNLLLSLTADTIPLEKPSPREIHDKLSNRVISRALFDYNIRALCGSCECNKSCKHYFNGMLLHEIDAWTNSPDQKEYANIGISGQMKELGIFPDLFDGELAFVVQPEEGKLMGAPVIMDADKAPAEDIQKFKNYVKQGLMYDASAAQFAIYRKVFSMSLLIKLFDEYQETHRRQPSKYPMERLFGCGHCRGSCQGQSAKKCQTCKVSWFCCERCMVDADHKPCPHGKEMDSACIFY